MGDAGQENDDGNGLNGYTQSWARRRHLGASERLAYSTIKRNDGARFTDATTRTHTSCSKAFRAFRFLVDRRGTSPSPLLSPPSPTIPPISPLTPLSPACLPLPASLSSRLSSAASASSNSASDPGGYCGPDVVEPSRSGFAVGVWGSRSWGVSYRMFLRMNQASYSSVSSDLPDEGTSSRS